VNPSLLLVGHLEPGHVGAHLAQASQAVGLRVHACDAQEAFAGPRWQRQLAWRLGGHRPVRLAVFGHRIIQAAHADRPRWLLATGLAPLSRTVLETLRASGVQTLNYLTDDPWNPVHRAGWFLNALPGYDHVFSPRQAVLEDLRRAGVRAAHYLPFAYAPALHYPDPPTAAERARWTCDAVFVGGADRDRVPWILPPLRAGLTVRLYGGYWDRWRATRPWTLGFADPAAYRHAVGAAAVALCLVRRANRDGHAMRTFELAAMRACLLAEATAEHQALLGPEGQAALYCHTPTEMLEKLRWLLARPRERVRLADAAYRLVTQGHHTYADRLAAMVEMDAGRS